MVTAVDDDGVQVMRNSSSFKSVPTAKEAVVSTQMREDSVDVAAPLQSNAAPLRRYPQRSRTRPVKLDDYVCD